MLKTSAYGLGFQHLPRDLANVDAWKTMFDSYINVMFLISYEHDTVLVASLAIPMLFRLINLKKLIRSECPSLKRICTVPFVPSSSFGLFDRSV